MDDGQEYGAKIRYPLDDPHNPLSWDQLEARFHELVSQVIDDAAKRQEMIERVKSGNFYY
jgi:2-methylcitrate dehydratase PrpD